MLARALISEFVVNTTCVINHYIMLFNQEKRDNKEAAADKQFIHKYLHEGLHAIMQQYTDAMKKSVNVPNKPLFLKELKAKNVDYATRFTNKIMGV